MSAVHAHAYLSLNVSCDLIIGRSRDPSTLRRPARISACPVIPGSTDSG